MTPYEILKNCVESALRLYDNPTEQHNIVGGWARGEVAWAMMADLRTGLEEAEKANHKEISTTPTGDDHAQQRPKHL